MKTPCFYFTKKQRKWTVLSFARKKGKCKNFSLFQASPSSTNTVLSFCFIVARSFYLQQNAIPSYTLLAIYKTIRLQVFS